MNPVVPKSLTRSVPAPALVDLHSLHGRWKVAAGRHPIPELVEIVFQIPVKFLDRLIVNTGCSPVRLYPFIRFPNPSFGNTPRLCFIQKVDLPRFGGRVVESIYSGVRMVLLCFTLGFSAPVFCITGTRSPVCRASGRSFSV